MSKNIIIFALSIIFAGALVAGLYIYKKKNYPEFELVKAINSSQKLKDGYPYAYYFFHSNKDIEDYMKCLRRFNGYMEDLKRNGVEFDFENYSYCITLKMPVEKMCYGYEYSKEMDPTYKNSIPKNSNTIFVDLKYQGEERIYIKNGEGKFILQREFGKCKKTNFIYVYRLKKNTRLRGCLD